MLFVSLECANKGFQNFFMFSDVVDDMFVVQMKEEKGTRILAVQHTRSGDLSWVVWWSCALLYEAANPTRRHWLLLPSSRSIWSQTAGFSTQNRPKPVRVPVPGRRRQAG